MENLINEQRVKLRAEHNLSEEQFLIYLAPGNTEEETQKYIQLFKDSLNVFLKKTQ